MSADIANSQADLDAGPDWQEDRRLKAWRLKNEGWSQRQIANELGVTEGAVSQWIKRAREGGIESLRSRHRRSRSRGLSEKQLVHMAECLEFGAQAFGFPDDNWNKDRFLWLLENKFGVDLASVESYFS